VAFKLRRPTGGQLHDIYCSVGTTEHLQHHCELVSFLIEHHVSGYRFNREMALHCVRGFDVELIQSLCTGAYLPELLLRVLSQSMSPVNVHSKLWDDHGSIPALTARRIFYTCVPCSRGAWRLARWLSSLERSIGSDCNHGLQHMSPRMIWENAVLSMSMQLATRSSQESHRG
jgi:hypothetical protein